MMSQENGFSGSQVVNPKKHPIGLYVIYQLSCGSQTWFAGKSNIYFDIFSQL
jgi:hypothetical protein